MEFRRILPLIAILVILSSVLAPSASALTVAEEQSLVNGVQATDASLPSGVANPKWTVGSLISEIFWGSADGSKNGKIKPQYVDVTGISTWTQSGANAWYAGTGSVGIGTSSPQRKMHIYSTDGLGFRLENNGSWNAVLEIQSDNGAQTAVNFLDSAWSAQGQVAYFQWAGNNFMRFTTLGTERIRLDSAGNVGIGTSVPGTKLDVMGTIRSAVSDANIWGTVSIDNPAKTAGNASSWKIYNMSGWYGNSLQFWAYDNVGCWTGLCVSRLTLMDNGNVGIGTSSPSYKLDVMGNMRVVSGDNSYSYYGPNATWGGQLYVGASPNRATTNTAQVIATDGNLHLDSGTNGKATYVNYYSQTSTFINPQGWNVGIGTTSPSYKLDVSWNARITWGAYLPWINNGTLAVGGGSIGGTDAVIYAEDQTNNDWGIVSYKWSADYGLDVRVGAAATYGIRLTGGWAEKFRVDGYGNIYANSWIRNNNSGEWLYNNATGNHWYSDSANYWNLSAGGTGVGGIRFRNGHAGAIQWYDYFDSNGFGLLSSDGNWRVRTQPGYQELYGTTYMNGAQAYVYYDRDNTGYYMDPNGNSQVSSVYANNWFRAQGDSGFYFQDHGKGWYMTGDNYWIRNYWDWGIYTGGEMRAGTVSGNNWLCVAGDCRNSWGSVVPKILLSGLSTVSRTTSRSIVNTSNGSDPGTVQCTAAFDANGNLSITTRISCAHGSGTATCGAYDTNCATGWWWEYCKVTGDYLYACDANNGQCNTAPVKILNW